jgi:hypothetical protein
VTQDAINRIAADLSTIRSWGEGSPGVAAPETDTINVLIGDGANVLSTGIKAAVVVHFNAYIMGAYLHEFDGVTGSVVIGIDKSPAYVVGSTPTFTSIVSTTPPTISGGRYGANETLTNWTRQLTRSDVLRFNVTSVSTFTRLLITLRVRRLEP